MKHSRGGGKCCFVSCTPGFLLPFNPINGINTSIQGICSRFFHASNVILQVFFYIYCRFPYFPSLPELPVPRSIARPTCFCMFFSVRLGAF